jgi:hypothetical protein
MYAALLLAAVVNWSVPFETWKFKTGDNLRCLLVPITLGMWVLAWCYLFRLSESRLIAVGASALTTLYIVTEFVRRPALNGGLLPTLAPAAAVASKWDRYAFSALLLYIVYRGVRERGLEAWFALPAVVTVSIGRFSGELLAFGVPGIWFPFGMGVSLANYAYLASTLAIALLLWSRLYVPIALSNMRLGRQPSNSP